MSEELLQQFAAWREFRSREAAYERRAASIREKALAVRRAYEEKHSRWQEAVRAAVEAGDLPPAPPPPLDEESGRQAEALLRMEGDQIRADRHRTLSLLAAPIADLMKERERERVERCRPAVDTLETARVDWQNDVALLRQALMAQQAEMTVVPRPSPADRLRTGIALDLVVNAVITGRSLVEPEPVAPAKVSPFDADDERMTFQPQGDGVRLGLRGAEEPEGNFRRRTSDNWPQSPPRGRSSPGVHI